MGLEAPQRVPDAAGGHIESWQTLGMLWADLEPRSARQTGDLAGQMSIARFRITVRAAPVGQSPRPVPGQRFRMGTRIFAIDAVSEAPDNDMYLRCDVTEELAA